MTDNKYLAALNPGPLVAGGELEQNQVELPLLAAAVGIGLTDSEASTTIKSGMNEGITEPRTANRADAKSFAGDSADHWSFEDAETAIIHCPNNSKARLELAREIFSNNAFDAIEMDLIKGLAKRHMRINKAAAALFNKGTDGQTNETPPTHHDIATSFVSDTFPNKGEVVGTEGGIWHFNSSTGLFQKTRLSKIETAIGKNYPGTNNKKGGDYQAIARLVYKGMECSNFFANAPYGLPVTSGFVRIDVNGNLQKEPYTPQLRQRFKIDAEPENLPAPLLEKYLQDSFAGDNLDADKILLQEILGGLITGSFNKLQVAVLLIGWGENGKSVFLEILEALFPDGLKSAISPDKFDDPSFLANLAGKVVNIVGELDKSSKLKAVFKDVVGCDTPITAKLPYRDPFSFKPGAGHIFAGNHFPQTTDHSHGFYRRWVVLRFENRVQEGTKIPNLGARIIKEELPQVLYWALIGAKRLAKNGWKLSLSAKHESEIKKWQIIKDSVVGFFADEDVVEHAPGHETPSQIVYERYKEWCSDTGVRPDGYNNFLESAELQFKRVKPQRGRRSLRGLRLVG